MLVPGIPCVLEAPPRPPVIFCPCHKTDFVYKNGTKAAAALPAPLLCRFCFLPCYGMLRTIWERVRGVRQGASARYILCTAIFVPSTTYVFTRAQISLLLCALCAENYFREHFFRTEPVLFAFSVSCAAFVLPFYRFFMLFCIACLRPTFCLHPFARLHRFCICLLPAYLFVSLVRMHNFFFPVHPFRQWQAFCTAYCGNICTFLKFRRIFRYFFAVFNLL